LSFKLQFLKVERSDEIVNQKSLSGEVLDSKIDVQAKIADA
jgi:hypothetical protein